MSGAFGWHNNSSEPKTESFGQHSYDKAKEPYSPKVTTFGEPAERVVTVKTIGGSPAQPTTPDPWPKRHIQTAAPKVISGYPEATHSLKSTATNVVIVSLDVTSSMQEWPQEIFRRLPLLYQEACQYLGTEDLEILFIAHGDARTDNFPIQVSRFGRGQELDQILGSFYMKCGGGGQGEESQELVAYYLLKQVDTSSAQNVYTFFVTDEAAVNFIDEQYVKKYLGAEYDLEFKPTKEVFNILKNRMKVFTILCETKNSYYDPSSIKRFWEDHIGKENVLPLDDSRRVVDVMLGTMAKLTGQMDTFTKNLMGRQEGSAYADQNVKTVEKSIALVGPSTLSSPIKKRKPLL